jgi:hypothetical protein
VWAGVDNAWEQENAEARKMLENAAESHTSGARFVGWRFCLTEPLPFFQLWQLIELDFQLSIIYFDWHWLIASYVSVKERLEIIARNLINCQEYFTFRYYFYWIG